jgi:hypothetical protein
VKYYDHILYINEIEKLSSQLQALKKIVEEQEDGMDPVKMREVKRAVQKKRDYTYHPPGLTRAKKIYY